MAAELASDYVTPDREGKDADYVGQGVASLATRVRAPKSAGAGF